MLISTFLLEFQILRASDVRAIELGDEVTLVDLRVVITGEQS